MNHPVNNLLFLKNNIIELSSVALIAVSLVCGTVTETLYKKVDFPIGSWYMLNTTTIATIDGVKQCGFICTFKAKECNIFMFENNGNICTYGHVSIYTPKNMMWTQFSNTQTTHKSHTNTFKTIKLFKDIIL